MLIRNILLDQPLFLSLLFGQSCSNFIILSTVIIPKTRKISQVSLLNDTTYLNVYPTAILPCLQNYRVLQYRFLSLMFM
jgi:hypothetical protein